MFDPDRLTVPPTAPPTDVIVLPAFSKLSFANKLAAVITSPVSSLVLAVSPAMSATPVTVIATVSVSESGTPALSVESTVSVSAPLKSALPV